MTTSTHNLPLYIFLHHYKTAGTTLSKNLALNFPGRSSLRLSVDRLDLDQRKQLGHPANPGWARHPVDQYVSRRARDSTRLLMGHLVYPGIHQHAAPTRRPRYFTFVRHPVERVVSLYSHLKHASRNHWHDEITSRGWSLDDWLEQSDALWARDGQTRHLLLGQHEAACRERTLTPTLLPAAKDILSDFWFVGLTETFAQDSSFLYGRLGHRRFHASDRILVSRRKEPIGPDTYGRIMAANRSDFELYEHARQIRRTFLRRQGIRYLWLGFGIRLRRRASHAPGDIAPSSTRGPDT